MRVLQVMASGARGGGADHLLGLLPELARLGVHCDAAVGGDGPTAARLRELGFRVEPLSLMHARLDPTAPARLAALVRRLRPDLVHYHGTRAAFFGALARPLLGRGAPPAVYTVHGLSYRKPLGVAGRWCFLAAEALACRLAARVISVSQVDLEDLRRRGLVAAGRGVHIRNGVDVARFRPGDRARARRRTGLAVADTLAMTVARLVPQKAVGDLVEAVARCPGVTLAVVGDGPERAALEAQARAEGAAVRFLGARDDVDELLRAADLFVLSSRWEGEPVALLEALATGLACVVTATEGAREILGGTRAGLLVPVGDVAALARAMRRLAVAPELRRRLGRAARRAVQSRGHAEVARAVARLYAQLA